jgi:hypothetical protein
MPPPDPAGTVPMYEVHGTAFARVDGRGAAQPANQSVGSSCMSTQTDLICV